MTAWCAAEITVTLASDLHCPDRPLGFVARTLPFVPARIPWYALVPPVVALYGLPDVFASYAKIESIFKTCLRFTPFFPLDDKDTPLFPWAEGEGKHRVETELLGSRHGVALAYDTRSARKNHLFETEVLLARWRTGAPTRLRGYGFWKEAGHDGVVIGADGGINDQPLAALLARCQWGGQRNQGMGALKHVEVTPAQPDNSLFFQGLQLEGSFPRMLVDPDGRGACYLHYNDNEKYADKVQGKVVPLAGRRYAEGKGSGLTVESVVLAWDLGWKNISGSEMAVELNDMRYGAMKLES